MAHTRRKLKSNVKMNFDINMTFQCNTKTEFIQRFVCSCNRFLNVGRPEPEYTRFPKNVDEMNTTHYPLQYKLKQKLQTKFNISKIVLDSGFLLQYRGCCSNNKALFKTLKKICMPCHSIYLIMTSLEVSDDDVTRGA